MGKLEKKRMKNEKMYLKTERVFHQSPARFKSIYTKNNLKNFDKILIFGRRYLYHGIFSLHKNGRKRKFFLYLAFFMHLLNEKIMIKILSPIIC
jgi:hypothetical protein